MGFKMHSLLEETGNIAASFVSFVHKSASNQNKKEVPRSFKIPLLMHELDNCVFEIFILVKR